ncbi:GntR family transcriptional regulator [Microbacterium sp. JZ31]|uniref:GntR family transcriptional regulator n=1 Tax=Microbacterium sp. JZ31 TaxID=1906274 RepID=UPI001EE3ED25|nr:GntR family transcriptional regulator [Microbacterium sp. JZ31]
MTAPRYRDVAAAIAQSIADGDVPIGAALPGEHRLAAVHGVARGTVRSALALLARRGVLEPRRGAGWIVQSASLTHGLSGFGSFASWARARGLTPSGLVVAETTAPATGDEARLLSVGAGADVLRITRLRALDGQTVMIERSCYPAHVASAVAGLPRDTPSYAAVLADAGFAEEFGSHRIDAVAASGEDARLLGVRRSSPLLRVKRQAFARDGRPIDLSEDRYLPGTVAFEARASASSGAFGRILG